MTDSNEVTGSVPLPCRPQPCIPRTRAPAALGGIVADTEAMSFNMITKRHAEAMQRRVVFDAIGILAGTILGYRLLVDFIRTEGLATVRMQTELLLAHEIQATLVPTLSLHVDRFEIYGNPSPAQKWAAT